MMASPAVKAAVEARLTTTPGWSGLTTWPLAPLNDAAASPAHKFLEIEYPVALEERQEMGPKPAMYREIGSINFSLNLLVLDGVGAALAAAEELRDLFRDEDFDGVTTFEASPATFDERNRRGAFYRVPFEVPYHYDVIK